MSNIQGNRYGFVRWCWASGGNLEIENIKVFKKRRGYGTALVRRILRAVEDNPPPVIFGFTASDNLEAQAFYRSVGFFLQEIEGFYGDGSAFIFWQGYKVLQENLR